MLEDLAKLAKAEATQVAISLAEHSLQPTPGHGKRRGVAQEIEAITLAELKSFWRERIKPGNARLVLAGRFDAAKVRGRIETAFASLPAGTPPVLREGLGAIVRGTLVMSQEPGAAIAIAVGAPPVDSPLFPAFLVHASRLAHAAQPPRTWRVYYDPVRRPGMLLVTSPVGAAEEPEPAAARVHSEFRELLTRPLAATDLAGAKDRFALFIEAGLIPAVCSRDPKAFSVARARRAQLKLEGATLAQALSSVTQAQLDETARLFDEKSSAAVIAGAWPAR
ncbi:MAG: hypothetical protein QM765_50060 [Myxococcales bacterium]